MSFEPSVVLPVLIDRPVLTCITCIPVLAPVLFLHKNTNRHLKNTNYPKFFTKLKKYVMLRTEIMIEGALKWYLELRRYFLFCATS